MRILITGSSGEIGTNLGLKLLSDGHEVFGVDIRENTWTDKIPTTIQDLSRLYDKFDGGIGDTKYPENIDVVVHLAAHAKVHELVENPLRSIENVNMIFNVLEFCRRNDLPMIYSSSREVYGDIKRYNTSEDETHINFTESPYSASKISGEAFVYSYAKCYDLNYIVFRFSNVYGRYDNDIERMERVIPLFIRKINNDEPIKIFGEDKILDFTYVDDCVQGIYKGIKLLNEKKGKEKVGHTINLAFGEGNSLVRMTELIAKNLGKEPNFTVEESKVGEVTHYIADISKAQEVLGYAPEVNLEEGIKRCVEWNKEWAEKNGKSL